MCLDKCAPVFQGKSVTRCQENPARAFQEKVARVFRARSRGNSAKLFQANSASLFLVRVANRCRGNNVPMCRSKVAAMCRDSRARMCRGKCATKCHESSARLLCRSTLVASRVAKFIRGPRSLIIRDDHRIPLNWSHLRYLKLFMPPLLKTPHIPPVDLSDLVKNTGTMKLRAFFIVVINHTVALVIVICYLFIFIRNEIKDIEMTKHIFCKSSHLKYLQQPRMMRVTRCSFLRPGNLQQIRC